MNHTQENGDHKNARLKPTMLLMPILRKGAGLLEDVPERIEQNSIFDDPYSRKPVLSGDVQFLLETMEKEEDRLATYHEELTARPNGHRAQMSRKEYSARTGEKEKHRLWAIEVRKRMNLVLNTRRAIAVAVGSQLLDPSIVTVDRELAEKVVRKKDDSGAYAVKKRSEQIREDPFFTLYLEMHDTLSPFLRHLQLQRIEGGDEEKKRLKLDSGVDEIIRGIIVRKCHELMPKKSKKEKREYILPMRESRRRHTHELIHTA